MSRGEGAALRAALRRAALVRPALARAASVHYIARMSTDIVDFRSSVDVETSRPAADRLLEGDPVQAVRNHYADAGNQFFAGVWSSTRGKWRVSYSEHEFCHVTRGRVRITSVDGKSSTFGPGDSFVVPAGFSGTWEVLEDCEKLYAIFQSK